VYVYVNEKGNGVLEENECLFKSIYLIFNFLIFKYVDLQNKKHKLE
jgi:hypothetical protein